MLQIDPLTVAEFLNKKFSEKCSVISITDPQTRFKLKIEYEEFFVIVSASEARICIAFPVNEFQNDLRQTLLLQITHIRQILDSSLEPYKLTLWSNDSKSYSSLPDFEKLKNNPDFLMEICTRPCDITNEEKALGVLYELLGKSLEWIFSTSNVIGEEEGERKQDLSSRVERSTKNRALCIALYGYKCQVCEKTMSEMYGDIADNFIHVHHLESIAKSGKRWIEPQRDLITVCPNCHSMLHRSDPPMSPDKLKNLIKEHRG